MRAFLLRRALSTLGGALTVSVLIFVLIRFVPGDAVTLWMGQEGSMTPEVQATLRKLFGLSDPVHIQYFHWLGDLLHGDLGYSLRSHLPVVTLLAQTIPVTAELSLLAVALAALVALPLGVLSAVRRNTPLDLLVRLLGLVGLSMPNFWIGVLFIMVTSSYFKWLPPLNYASPAKDLGANLQQMVMPAVALALPLMAVLMRMTRSVLLEVIGQEYIRTARSKGLKETTVLTRHAMRNALIPIITVIGIQLGRLLGGAVIMEQIFGLPGMGSLLVSSIVERDYAVVQGTVLTMGLLFIFVQVVVDTSYAYVDPRVRFT
jgi:peptide/nickel transport system permease protein